MVKNAFENIFEGYNFELLESKNEKEDFLKRITVKNAVARGALYLEGSGYYNHSENEEYKALDRYIWNIEEIEEYGDEAEPVLRSGDNKDKGFKCIGRRGEEDFRIYYSFISTVEDEDDENLKSYSIKIPNEVLDEDKYFVFIRPYDGKYVECGFGEYEDDTNITPVMIINSDNGKVEVKNEL